MRVKSSPLKRCGRSRTSIFPTNLPCRTVRDHREIFHAADRFVNWDYDSANAKFAASWLGKQFNLGSTADIDWDAPCDMTDFPSEAALSALNSYPGTKR